MMAEKGEIEFNFSERYIQQRKHSLLILFFFMALGIIWFCLLITDYNVIETLRVSSIVILIFAIILTIEIPLIFSSLRKMKLKIYDNKIVKHYGKRQQTVLLDNIIKIKRIENVKGKIVIIQLHQKNKRVFYIYGFNKMVTIYKLLKEKMSESVLLETKRYRLDWENPGITLLMVIGWMTLFAFIASKGDNAMNIFVTFFSLFAGSFLLLFKPISKMHLHFKWVEIIMGLILILLGIYFFIVVFV